MELILFSVLSLPDKFSDIIRCMDLHKNLNHLLLALIIGIVSLGVSFIGDMSKNMQNIANSVQELNVQMRQVIDTMKDHEIRLRQVENRHNNERN